ncbi:MAG: hypothetical protein CALGDGBN_03073 [Pseudomonadales bacterium]|nr:hypothetical protein [Pseudomonadales bacterium]
MAEDHTIPRRDLLAGMAGLGIALGSAGALAADEHAAHAAHAGHAAKDAAADRPVSPRLQELIRTASDCLQKGRYCLSRCTDHLAAGTGLMAECQRGVMNMLPVVGAMADVAGYASASHEDMAALATVCARFCRACAKACEPHSPHHEECQACEDACAACAEACDALVAA